MKRRERRDGMVLGAGAASRWEEVEKRVGMICKNNIINRIFHQDTFSFFVETQEGVEPLAHILQYIRHSFRPVTPVFVFRFSFSVFRWEKIDHQPPAFPNTLSRYSNGKYMFICKVVIMYTNENRTAEGKMLRVLRTFFFF